MDLLLHKTSSIGGIVKKIMAINPELGTAEIIALVRKATHTRGKEAGEYASLEIVDETLALELARQTLRASQKIN
jgi:hypothetical protein